jgi:hypothetical protein
MIFHGVYVILQCLALARQFSHRLLLWHQKDQIIVPVRNQGCWHFKNTSTKHFVKKYARSTSLDHANHLSLIPKSVLFIQSLVEIIRAIRKKQERAAAHFQNLALLCPPLICSNWRGVHFKQRKATTMTLLCKCPVTKNKPTFQWFLGLAQTVCLL